MNVSALAWAMQYILSKILIRIFLTIFKISNKKWIKLSDIKLSQKPFHCQAPLQVLPIKNFSIFNLFQPKVPLHGRFRTTCSHLN